MMIIQRFQALVVLAALNARAKVRSFIYDERGDTNFISIIIILALALAVAAVFLFFKDEIVNKAKDIIKIFTNKDWNESRVE